MILKNGSIAAAGDFETLSASGLDFASLLARGEEEEERVKTAEQQDTADDSSMHESFRKRQLSIHSVTNCFRMFDLVMYGDRRSYNRYSY